MTRDEVAANIGAEVLVTGEGDLWFLADLRPVIGPPHRQPPYPVSVIVKLSKGGMAVLRHEGREYSVPPRNVELL